MNAKKITVRLILGGGAVALVLVGVIFALTFNIVPQAPHRGRCLWGDRPGGQDQWEDGTLFLSLWRSG
jgi:hypothetical protein